MKKRTFAIFLAASLGASILGGCSKGNEAGSPAVSAAPSATTQDQTDAKQEQTAASAKSSASGTSVSDTSVSGAGTSADSPKLPDLTGDGVSLIMGDVDSTPIGKIAKKAMTDAGIFDQVKIEATTATAPQMSTALAAGEADAAIVWKENCDAEGVEIVDTKDLDPYIKTIPAASLSCASDKDALAAFNQYLDSDTVKEIWVKYGYEIVE